VNRTPATTLGHRPALDVLRGVAVLLVIALHYSGRARAVIPGAGIGVNVFFVLSGFLITRLLVEELHRDGRIDLRAFMRRRAARLLPALVPLLAWVLVAEFVFGIYGDPAGVVRGVAATALYVRNWLTVAGMGEPALGIAWSLAVEEQFYLLWPPVFMLVARRSGLRGVRHVANGLVLLAVAQTAVRSAVFGQSVEVLKFATDTNGMIGLMVGCALALQLRIEPARGNDRRRWQVAATTGVGSLAALVLLVGDSPLLPRGGWGIAAVGSAALIGWTIRALPATAGTRLRTLRWIGRHSYALYLWHLPVFAVVLAWAPTVGEVGSRVVALTGSFVAASLSMRFVEAPARRWILDRAPERAVDVTDRVDLCREGSADDGELVIDDVERIRPVG